MIGSVTALLESFDMQWGNFSVMYISCSCYLEPGYKVPSAVHIVLHISAWILIPGEINTALTRYRLHMDIIQMFGPVVT